MIVKNTHKECFFVAHAEKKRRVKERVRREWLHFSIDHENNCQGRIKSLKLRKQQKLEKTKKLE